MVLVIGGSGCGKSAYAENRIRELAQSDRIYYLATMQVYGEEGRKKVERHVEMRREKGMLTLEQTRDVADVIPRLPSEKCCVILEDLGNLVANEMFQDNADPVDWQVVAGKIISQVRLLEGATKHLVIVTNNVFEDGITYGEGTMNYLKALGRVNAELAGTAAEVTEVVVGIPLSLK